jgi:hypothetical protein
VGRVRRRQHGGLGLQLLDRLQQPLGVAGADRDMRQADAVEGGERGAGDERAGVVGRDDPLPGLDTRGRVAARRAGDPVVEVGCGQRDVARRSGRPAGRVDADELARLRAEVGAERVLARARGPQLLLVGERELRGLREPAREALQSRTVEGRALAQVRELLAEARVVEGELLIPRQGLGVSARTRPPPRQPLRARTRSGVPAPRRGARAGPRCAPGSAPP